MTHHEREDWLRDVDARQRNIVFPDTAHNEARFWRNIYESKGRLTTIQRIGVGVWALAIVALVLITIFVWHIGLLNWIFGGVLLLGFLFLIKLSTASRPSRR